MSAATEIIAARTMNALHIWLDLGFLLLFLFVLLWTKRYQAVIVGMFGAALYFLVDYGVFYLLLETRVVEGADTLWFLLWLSVSYGFTNLVWIWLWLDRDRRTAEWSIFIVAGWLMVAIMSTTFGSGTHQISIVRGTASYHGVMAALLFIGYGILCVYNIRQKDSAKRAPLLWILAIGILVQFSWEAVLAVTGIRNLAWNTIVVNSLLETNMGLPFLYLIHRTVTRRWDEQLTRIAA
jgi:hypothetical protein